MTFEEAIRLAAVIKPLQQIKSDKVVPFMARAHPDRVADALVVIYDALRETMAELSRLQNGEPSRESSPF